MIDRFNLYKWIFLIVFWVEACFGFVTQELLPPLEGIGSLLFLLCDALILGVGCLTIRKKGDLAVVATLVVLSWVSTVMVNHLGLVVYVNGLRSYFGLLFAFPLLRWFFRHERAEEFRATMLRTLKWWLWLQAFCITWQFIRHGANDWGGGSMGLGASGITSMLIYLVSYALIVREWDKSNFFGSLRRNWVLVFLLYPTFLNETKVSFLMFALYFILLVKYDRKFVARLIYIIPMTVAAVTGLVYAYFAATKQDPEEVLSEAFFEDYLYGLDIEELIKVGQMVQDGLIEVSETQYWSVDIPRFAKLGLAPSIVDDTAGGDLLGAGIGQFKGGTSMDNTAFAKEYEWLLIGSRPWLFFMFIELGYLGILWWICTALYQFGIRRPRHLYARRMTIFMFCSLLIICVYNDSLRDLFFMLMLALLMMLFIYPDKEEQEAFEEYERERHKDLVLLRAEGSND